MNNTFEQIFLDISRVIDRDGFILDHNLDNMFSDHIYLLEEQGVLIGCDKIESTKNFMNSSYYFTWADNRFNLYIHNDNNLSWIDKMDR